MQSGWTSGSVSCPDLNSEKEVSVAQTLQETPACTGRRSVQRPFNPCLRTIRLGPTRHPLLWQCQLIQAYAPNTYTEH
ncbi:hypothetical protein DPX16_7050 [Anabarilius grahami]|uniref:Uncharacterized protein n=1 Tax=Anabarilius grahami TaxID=495550 RepID=A0A3N0Y2G1_ANAGA|nr:hypothetical protein DPX16_7050 [Anabarilius grahami]